MSETILNAEQTAPETPGSGEEAIGFDPVCLEVPRIYDNCGAKDCLRDLTVFFTPENQTLIETATSVRVTKVSVITATVDVDSVAFNRGRDLLFPLLLRGLFRRTRYAHIDLGLGGFVKARRPLWQRGLRKALFERQNSRYRSCRARLLHRLQLHAAYRKRSGFKPGRALCGAQSGHSRPDCALRAGGRNGIHRRRARGSRKPAGYDHHRRFLYNNALARGAAHAPVLRFLHAAQGVRRPHRRPLRGVRQNRIPHRSLLPAQRSGQRAGRYVL